MRHSTRNFLCLAGADALTALRRERLLTEPVATALGVRDAHASHIYFAELDAPLDATTQKLLARLLEADCATPAGRVDLLVTPRPGTISPWSSKATDIVHNCGLDQIRRVERGAAWRFEWQSSSDARTDVSQLAPLVHDRMTEVALTDLDQARSLFDTASPGVLERIDVIEAGVAALAEADARLGLALSDAEHQYLYQRFAALGRNPTDVELMMFAQANSEHCRHKIFNADWVVDGEPSPRSLFGMIRHTHECHPGAVLSAYHDNSAVIAGPVGRWLIADPVTRRYVHVDESIDILMKVETHNHPTAISPYPGAATGSGGEIRDEAATGRGSRSKAGLTGFSVSNLRIPGFVQPWEGDHGRPERIASALEIMLEAPIGAAAFNNEFGRPALAGYFRTFELETTDGEVRGYHKPIMLAGGMGNIRRAQVAKCKLAAGAKVVVLGGPAMLIGLGGGAASSMASGSGEEALDFASVQRDNPEMERRCQEVINQCWAFGDANPIASIHDVGAGGLSNAVPEIIADAKRGGRFELRDVPSADPGMSPKEIWCNEAQERYVLALVPGAEQRFTALCARERCPFAIIGEATSERHLLLSDRDFGDTPVDIPMDLLFGKPPALHRSAIRRNAPIAELALAMIDLDDAVQRVLRLPGVADKSFLITIGDRSITGLVARDQMVGRWQVPVADCAVTASGYDAYTGEAMAIGERAPLALSDAPASGRMAVGEAITNIAAARIADLGQVVLSANWMAACGHPGEDARLHDTVRAVGMELCPALGIAIPVGKDSLSMRTVWREQDRERAVIAPLSLAISAFSPVLDVRRTLTPVLRLAAGESDLLLVDLGGGQARLGGSALAQVYGSIGAQPPDLDDPERLAALFRSVQRLNAAGLILAYHDRSDGGLLVALCEMAFAGHCGLNISLASGDTPPLTTLFNEELGVVLQIRRADRGRVAEIFAAEPALSDAIHVIGQPLDDDRIQIECNGVRVLDQPRSELHRLWSETSWRMQARRDDPDCARQAYERACDPEAGGLRARLSFDPNDDITAPAIGGQRPRMAILREQGVNGQIEMAAAFDRAGFECVDVHMSDLQSGEVTLDTFKGLVACGGFSYGDVLGAGGGWAASALHNSHSREQLAAFFARTDSFALGVCNGCQMLARLGELLPRAARWPRFLRNRSDQFEARLVLTEVLSSPSILLAGMVGSILPTVVAHGEGRVAVVRSETPAGYSPCLRYVDNRGAATEHYPENPNGSPDGATGFCSADGRVTIMMPHPERLFRTVQHSWHPEQWGADGPWLRIFRNARAWVN